MNSTSKKRKPVTKDGLIQMSYYLREDQLDKIDEMVYFQKKNKSEIIREALDEYIKAYENLK